jgi:hypothetical protein
MPPKKRRGKKGTAADQFQDDQDEPAEKNQPYQPKQK